MNEITLYHGAKKIVSLPEYSKGTPFNDFGAGFYCTRQEDMAGQWACSRGSSGFINKYSIDLDGLKVLDLNSEQYTLMNWVAVILHYRKQRISDPSTARVYDYILDNFLVEFDDADIIMGNRCDDSYFTFARAFINGQISYEQLKYCMALGVSGEQYVIRSPKAYDALRFTTCLPADSALFYPRRKVRDSNARAGYWAEIDLSDGSGLYISDILIREVKADDQCLR